MSARDRRDQRNEAPAELRSAEQHAFAQGKRARAANQPHSANPYHKASLQTAWWSGYRYESNLRSGLRPLDTARRLP